SAWRWAATWWACRPWRRSTGRPWWPCWLRCSSTTSRGAIRRQAEDVVDAARPGAQALGQGPQAGAVGDEVVEDQRPVGPAEHHQGGVEGHVGGEGRRRRLGAEGGVGGVGGPPLGQQVGHGRRTGE